MSEDLEQRWRSDPGVNFLLFDTPEQLREHLHRVHDLALNGGQFGVLGFLYREQVRRLRELKTGERRK